ncbi:MAG: IS1595 family transposase [Bryobacteraceae bacterium]
MAPIPNPRTLQEAVRDFTGPASCISYLVSKRWPNGVTCPTCGSSHVGFLANQQRWQCGARHPKRQFSVKVGTIFEDSPLGLDKWLPVVWLLTNAKNGISSWEIHRAIGVTQKTAWFMLHRVRLAMQDEFHGGKLGGEVEVDETFIGGKARNMHKSKRERMGINGPAGPSAGSKSIVHGILERGKTVRVNVIDERSKAVVQQIVKDNVEKGAEVFTDALMAYVGLNKEYAHQIIDHAEAYVRENIHTNGLENFWSLLKRSLGGTYVSVEPFHLFRYVDEQAFRYNNRKPMDDADRFSYVIRKIVGKRLTYAELTGKTIGETERTCEEPF